jgi:DNA repair protein RadC
MIAELRDQEKPRERLVEHGPSALSDKELVAVLLRTGRRGQTVWSMAHEILEETGGLEGLVGARAEDLVREGLGTAKAASLIAAVEVGRRLARRKMPARPPLGRPSKVASYLRLRYQVRDQEVMGALYVDTRNKLMHETEIYRGTLSRAAVEPREILKEALRLGAAGLVLFHTHPSGDPAPSAEDLAFTRRLAEAGEVLGVRLVDHMIIGGPGRWVSLRERCSW